MPQSPELAGGEGFTFESEAAAFYLTALLAGAYAPGIDDRIVVRVSVQQRDFGEPLDDVIVDCEDAAKTLARLSLQVKRSLTISKANTNTDFRDIIRDSWATFKKNDFRINVDRYGTAVGTITAAKERTLKTLCDWARESLTADHFERRFSDAGSASADVKEVRDDIVALVEETKGAPSASEEMHQFLAHFVLIQFDFLREGAIDPPDAINRIRDCLSPDDAAKAPLVWSRIVQLARASAGKSGQFDRARLVRSLLPVAHIRGATSFRLDLDKLTELAKSSLSLIPDDIDGTKLDRLSLLSELDTKLTTARLVQVRGLPGSGKSVVMRRAVQRALERGVVFFLKAEQVEGTNWHSYARAQGLSVTPLEPLLVEVGAVGTPILFIDAIDRIEKEHQPVILDVIRTIVESSLLDNWRIVVSLRDTGIEVLRNWLGEFLRFLTVETVTVGQLTDEEAEVLAEAKPHLKPLLFGSAQVQEIVRRPFFAKVLSQSYLAVSGVSTFIPKSEIDLIANWWQRGGYNATGQSAIERQRALLALARSRARKLSQPIRLTELASIAHINELKSDGILQNAREGISVRFAHDIFFEWAFFHVLADCGAQWTDEIRECGEPPGLARVVELASQWEYEQGQEWRVYLTQTETSDVRSQWLRAWLLGPLGTAKFEADENQFATAVFADDFRLLKMALVWFQAERTAPNINILAGEFPQEQRQRFADLLGWPSDFAAWRRLINFILRHTSEIPQRLYPDIVVIFEVWQNALAGIRNPTSARILEQCASWLAASPVSSRADRAAGSSSIWKTVPDLDHFLGSLRQVLLRSSKAEPKFAADYLERVRNSRRFDDELFRNIINFAPIVAESLPQAIVELSLKQLRQELPEDQIARQRQEMEREAKWRKAVLAKPKKERTSDEERSLLMRRTIHPIGDFSHHDRERLSIYDDLRSFYPASPLREPFHALFKSSPSEGLRLLRELCNHAMTAWRQLLRHSPDRRGTPIPLELEFPWGKQKFWGSDREYLWFRSTWAPHPIACGFMALEEWCFAELNQGRSVDELIRQIVEGNECIAILGLASTLLLHTETVSQVTLPLVSSHRLLDADVNRWVQDFVSSTTNLIGFEYPGDKAHIEAIRAADARPARKKHLAGLIPKFVFAAEPFRERMRAALLNFKNNLPYQFEEQRNHPGAGKHLSAQAHTYAELADIKNYQAFRMEEGSDQIAIVHVSPSAAKPENVAKAEEADKHLKQAGLWTWAAKSFEEGKIQNTYNLSDAIKLAKGADSEDLFASSEDENELMDLSMRRGAVAATAAMALNFREGATEESLEWARATLARALQLPEKLGFLWSSSSIIPWHHAIFAARGLAADLRKEIVPDEGVRALLELVAHPLDVVSMAATEECCKLWTKDPRITWAGLLLAFSLCRVTPRSQNQRVHHPEELHSENEIKTAVDKAIAFYENENGWTALPLPPPAWVRVEQEKECWRREHSCEDYDADDVRNEAEEWVEPEIFWQSKKASEILRRIPVNEIINSGARDALLNFLAGVLDWTNQKNAPPWVKDGRRDRSSTRLIEWTNTLGGHLGHVAGLVPLANFRPRFLDPIFALEGDNCWALLSQFTSTYIAVYLYDAEVVPGDAVVMLDLCLDRFLKSSSFKRDAYRSGEFSGFYKPQLVRSLMFVSVERAELAARYANGNWSEIDRILPLIDKFVRAGGWAAPVMDAFLTLCERSSANYPADVFGDQILSVLASGADNFKGWRGTFIPARIAELMQHLAHRSAPMPLALAQKFLRILDMLVDMGDRRSAALQLSESFREVRFRS